MRGRFPSRSLVRPCRSGGGTLAARGHEVRSVCPPGYGAGRRRGPRARLLRSQGFTLIETMVALVVFAAGAMALYGLFNTNLIALARAHDVSRQVPAVRYAIEYLSSINPREEGSGRMELDGVEISWKARLLEPVRQSQSLSGRRGYFELGLYEVEFTVHVPERSLGTWRMRVVGYEKVREPAQ